MMIIAYLTTEANVLNLTKNINIKVLKYLIRDVKVPNVSNSCEFCVFPKSLIILN